MFFHQLVGQVQPQEETEERRRKAKFIICPIDRGVSHRVTWERHRVVMRQETGRMGRLRPASTGVSSGKVGQGEQQAVVADLHNFCGFGLWTIGVVPGCLAPGL